MFEVLKQVLTLLGGFAIFAAALAWLLKSVIIHFLDKDIEKYKTQVTLEANRSIEEFRAELQMAMREHDVKFADLHRKRAEVIAELHGLLNETSISIIQFSYRNLNTMDDEAIARAASTLLGQATSAFNFYGKHKIYLSRDLSKMIEDGIFAIHDQSLGYLAYHGKGIEHSTDLQLKMAADLRNRGVEIAQTLERLELEFRLLLGSESPPAQLIK